MGLYAKYFVPRLIDLAMRNKDTRRLRALWIPRAQGEVLEVGIGSGLNLPFYSPKVCRVRGVDPSVELKRMALRRAAGAPVKVEFLTQSAEAPLPIAAASIDTAVIMWTLCSIPEPGRALGEVRRVLKREGRLIFVEHGRAPDAQVARWQDRLTPTWSRFTGGCHLNRQVDELIARAGFEMVELATGYQPGPRPMTFTYQGVARLA